MENWRFIEANSDYMVSDHGRILSFKGKSKLIISSSITAKGYEYVAIRQKGIYVGYSVHHLVATAFIPNPKRLPQVNHLDGNKLNNHVANLEWCDAYDITNQCWPIFRIFPFLCGKTDSCLICGFFQRIKRLLQQCASSC